MAITCLIPAFKFEYMHSIIRSLGNQKVKPVRIIVSDDTPNNDFVKWIKQNQARLRKRINIEAVEGPKKGHYQNIEFLISIYRKDPTTHFHIFLDDDQIFPDFYYHQLRAFERHNAICSVSRRWISSDADVPISSTELPKEIATLDQHYIEISKELVATSYVESGVNWLGELSCAVFDYSFLNQSDQFHYCGDIPLVGLNDIGSFFKAAVLGKLVFLDHYLGTVKRSPTSLTGSKGFVFSLAILAKINFSILAIQYKALGEAQLKHAVRFTTKAWHQYYGENWVLERLRRFCNMLEQDDFQAFYAEFRDFHTSYYTDSKELANCHLREQLIQKLQAGPM